MEKSASDHSLYIESEGEEIEEKANGRIEDEENDSDSSYSSTENHNPPFIGSYTTSWPQSYRYRRCVFECICIADRSVCLAHKGYPPFDDSEIVIFVSSAAASSVFVGPLWFRHTTDSL